MEYRVSVQKQDAPQVPWTRVARLSSPIHNRDIRGVVVTLLTLASEHKRVKVKNPIYSQAKDRHQLFNRK